MASSTTNWKPALFSAATRASLAGARTLFNIGRSQAPLPGYIASRIPTLASRTAYRAGLATRSLTRFTPRLAARIRSTRTGRVAGRGLNALGHLSNAAIVGSLGATGYSALKKPKQSRQPRY